MSANRTYYTISFFFPFFFSIWALYTALYRVGVGLTPFQLVMAGTILEGVIFLTELPTGIVADTYSRRLSVIIGYFIIGFGFLIEGLFPVVWIVMAAQGIWGFGYTFISGAEEAWIVEEVGEEDVTAVFCAVPNWGPSVGFWGR